MLPGINPACPFCAGVAPLRCTIGGSVEEMPLAYKDIDRVMYTQETLVEVQGKFMPRIVRMNKE